MNQGNRDWSKTVFRLRGLPHTVESLQDVASLLSKRLGDVPVDQIRVFSLATTLKLWEKPQSKEATLMFITTPLMIQHGSSKDEWDLPPDDCQIGPNLILDTHFMGMTPLNDTKPFDHSYDCIAISGLSSHPFGSWQPKGVDKTFMWIRDDLPKSLRGTRAVIYGYDTKLNDSRSIQRISDLADELIGQLHTYGWDMPSAKPVAFIAHSLGGLVLKEALQNLAAYPDNTYKRLLSIVCGAIFFGVPNLGMEQNHFQAIVRNKPNEALIDDIARGSNYVRRLNEAFFANSFDKSLKCFWAYETAESPTTARAPNGQLNRDGPPAILVSRESATCRFVETNPPVTFPINETHSDMVKFGRDSRYFHNVVRKLLQILRPTCGAEHDVEFNSESADRQDAIPQDHGQISAYANLRGGFDELIELKISLTAEFRMFKSCLSEHEENDFIATTFTEAGTEVQELEKRQEDRIDLMDMKRLNPFLVSMQQFGEVIEAVKVSLSDPNAMKYIWGSFRYILRVISTSREAYNSVLDAYQEIGEQMAGLKGFQPIMEVIPHLRNALVLIYKDVLWFQRETIRLLKQRQWMELFAASWRDFAPTIGQIKNNLERYRRLIENKATFTAFEEIQNTQLQSTQTFEKHQSDLIARRQAIVKQWLSPFHSEAEQDKNRRTRSVCRDPGRWLLDDARFRQWLSPEGNQSPLLWMSGKPGAGKTILASVVIDEVRRISGATTVFFYCKYGKEAQNSFISVSRSILAQILNQHPQLLSYFHEKASMDSEVSLKSVDVAKEMMMTSLRSCELTYIIIDGLDECGRDARKELSHWFQEAIEDLPAVEMGSMRCLFVSQDDGIAVQDFRDVPAIKILNENLIDIEEYAGIWHQRIESQFDGIASKKINIRGIISARAQGMFIFAELFSKYLLDQASIKEVEEELKPEKLPVKLDHVYDRILSRIVESRGDHMVKYIRHILGWIVCARRPLRWREIQGAVCIDLENQCLDYDRKPSDSPKGLFASLIELQADGTVDLVHGTAREYLVSQDFVDAREAHYSLAMRSISYLTFEQFDLDRNDNDVREDILGGLYSFYDYASACWAMHLQEGSSATWTEAEFVELRETLETFIEVHWSSQHKPLRDVKRVQDSLLLFKTSKQFERIIQAVAWAKQQSGKQGLGPSPDEALKLSQVTTKIRSVMEALDTSTLSKMEVERLELFYGTNRFKCHRVNCYHYYQGFSSVDQRSRHTDKHDRPFLCYVTGCHIEVFGFATKNELVKHLFSCHGIDEFDDATDSIPSEPTSKKSPKPPQGNGKFKCHLCEVKFTRMHNLRNHLRAHSGEKLFSCDKCEQKFVRSSVRDRHSRGHGDKAYVCVGTLRDGTTWGCKASFKRPDKLNDHLRSKKGMKCLQPMLEAKLQARDGGEVVDDNNMFADQVGENADILMNAGKSLPSFGELLRLCGLDNAASDVSPGVNSFQEGKDGDSI